jgi:ubiquinone biosynthesis monooxygenase Coq7
LALAARLNLGETIGDRVMKVDHAVEPGAICIYTAQRWFAHWRAPEMVAELDEFLAHERGHRSLFGAELGASGKRRCRSYHFCAVGGLLLGAVTGLLGPDAVAATTVAIERIVLSHMREQLAELQACDMRAAETLRRVIGEEQAHHDLSAARILRESSWPGSSIRSSPIRPNS